ncbi:MAG: hypothetical protein U0599_30610, partial [Vicinamibacteria bacterium]
MNDAAASRARRAGCLVLALLFLAAAPPGRAADADLDARVFLIGDAGVPRPADPVLAALERDVAADSASSTVVFLGDNVYP